MNIDILREVGEAILLQIKNETLTNEDYKVRSTAARQYYSVSKILLEIAELDEKMGRASKAEIAKKLAEFHRPDKTTEIDIEKLIEKANEFNKRFKHADFATLQTNNISEIIELLTKIAALLTTAITAYKLAKKQANRNDRNKNTKVSRNSGNTKRRKRVSAENSD